MRIQRLQNIRHRSDQFTILVRAIPLCPEHKARSCCVDGFFSKHHPYTYYSYQMLYDGREIDDLLVSFCFSNALCAPEACFLVSQGCRMRVKDEVKSVEKNIDDLRKRSSTTKRGREPLLSNGTREVNTEIALREEKLQELSHKIHLLQNESELKSKVFVWPFLLQPKKLK